MKVVKYGIFDHFYWKNVQMVVQYIVVLKYIKSQNGVRMDDLSVAIIIL